MRTKVFVALMFAVSLLSTSIALAMHGEGEHGPPWGDWRGSGGWRRGH